jgi:1-acyl-sn-glycerol-3-phosphate acyltransferase
MVVAASTVGDWALSGAALARFLFGLILGHLIVLTLPVSRRAGLIPYTWIALAIWFVVPPSGGLSSPPPEGGTTNWAWLPGVLIGLIDASLQLSFEQIPSRLWPQHFMSTVGAKTAGIAVGVAAGLLAAEESWWLAVLAGVMAIVSLATLLRQTIELTAETMLLPSYRIHCRGPGRRLFPRYGPVIAIANHAAFFDPVWLGKVVPRRIIPMMTSQFYDRPILHFLVKRVFRAIRVQDSHYRYVVPELAEAIESLDKGECLVIFPEGNLRREEERVLRRFGQGVWRILKERPFTPVVACWIEGNWGSFFSHRGGPPMKNKYPDFWRTITVMMREPILLPPDVLADAQATRQYLMDLVLGLREEPIAPQPKN